MPLTMTTHICEHCGCAYEVSASRVKLGKARFCSLSCSTAYRNHANKLSPAERLWRRVKVTDTGCWEYQGYILKDGYPSFNLDGKTRHAHRVAWIVTHGPISSPNLVVCHKCDNKLCVNPDHLFLSSQAGNMADKVSKGRQNKGDNHPSRLHPEARPRGEAVTTAKLTEQQVRDIRERYASGGINQYQLADEYGVTQVLISRIIRRKVWRHVP
jgi:hypothetical protein